MKVALLCLVLVVVHNSDAIKCVQGDGKDQTAKDCAGAQASATKCSQPKFVEFTGLSSGVQYACGPCASGEGTTCDSCDGNTATACNVAKETGADFKCHDYEKDEDGKWIKKSALTTCQRLKTTTAITCNMPTDKADKAYVHKNKGCGACTPADKTAGKCSECNTAECNVKTTPIKCIQGDGSDMTAKVCATEAGKAA